MDEHYYESPNWFLNNTKRYDSYDRNRQAKVFLREYAAQTNNLQAALAEAAYMTGLERNGDAIYVGDASWSNIKCYIDDQLYVDYTYETAPVFFEESSVDENGDILMKFVNVSEQEITIDCTITDTDLTALHLKNTQMRSDDLSSSSIKKPETFSLKKASGFSVSFTLIFCESKHRHRLQQ